MHTKDKNSASKSQGKDVKTGRSSSEERVFESQRNKRNFG
jgi:hypothetical protein